MGKILSIDYGEKRIGIAISDENKILALPIKCIDAKKNFLGSVQTIMQEIENREDSIERIVIGLPLALNGKETSMSVKTRLFAQCMEEITKLPISLFDERFSSLSAASMLKETKTSRKKRTKFLDASSAAVFLQDFLNNPNRPR